MNRLKVGIVGGGPGGLMTAYALQKLAPVPYSATIFEAGDRLGGKVITRRFSRANVRYEVGAAEFYDYSPVDEDSLKELVLELGLSVVPMRGSSVIMNDRVLSNLEDVRDHLGSNVSRALGEFDRRAKDWINPREFYHSDEETKPLLADGRFDALLSRAIPDADARRYVTTMIHSDLAAEPQQTSPKYGLHNYLMNDPAYMQLYSIEGGNDLLVKELASRVHATKLLASPVKSIEKRSDGRLWVTFSHEGRDRHDDFDLVVVALPNSCLGSMGFTPGRLTDAMRRHHAHYDHPAHYLRITLLFDRPFWRTHLDESYWMLDRFGGCCLYDESSREPGSSHGVLGWLLGGDAARDLSKLGDEELIAAALDSLPDFLADGRACYLEGHVHRWAGAVSAMPGGESPISLDRRHQPEPVEHPNLFVVGDYLFDSTLNGVLDSAEYVAGWLGALMAESRLGTNGRQHLPPGTLQTSRGGIVTSDSTKPRRPRNVTGSAV